MLSVLTLTTILACIEPPPTASEGGTEPGGAAKPGAPEPGEEPAQAPPADEGVPDPAQVPEPHDGSPPGAPKPQYEQDSIPNAVTLNLKLACDDCSGELLVRVENASSQPPTLSTQKAFDAPGTGSINVPGGISAVLMIVDDADKNGQPTPGEKIGIWTGGLLETNSAPTLIELEVGVVPDEPPLPPAEDDPGRAAE